MEYSEKKFRKIFENHSAVKLLVDPETCSIVDANNAAAQFYNYSIDDLKKMNFFQINILPKDEVIKIIEKAKNLKRNYFELQHRKSTGEVCTVEVYGSTVEIEGKEYIHSIIHDATEKKAALTEIEILSEAVKQSPVMIVITDVHGAIEFANPKFEEVTGYKVDEVIGRTTDFLKSGVHTKEFYKNLWHTILDGKEWHGIFRNKRKNGELYWDSARISPIIDRDGEIENFVLIAEDITEQIEREKRLRKIEYILNETQAISKVGGWEYKISEDRLIWTRETYRIYAIPNETKVTLEEAFSYYNKKDQPDIKKAFEKCIQDGTKYNLRGRLTNAEGKELIISTSGKAIKEKNKIVKIVGNVADITEKAMIEEALRKSEEKYKVIIDATGEVFYELNFKNMKYNYIHPNIEKLTGYSTDEFNLSKITKKIERYGKKIDLEKERRKGNNRRHEIFVADYLIETKEGFEIWIADKSFPIYDKNNNVIGSHGVLRDITERKKLEADLINAKNQAINAGKMKDYFLSQISHEIRTPINTILNMTSLIKYDLGEFLEEKQSELFESVNKGGERLIRTIDLLINFSEVSAGIYKPQIEEVDIYRDVLLPIVSKKRLLARNNRVKIRFINSVDNSIINTDLFSVEQIFDQIIDNAIKYSSDNEVVITLDKNDGGLFFIEVADSGIGIEESYLPDLFEPFTQEEMGYSRKFDGNGIGLPLVKKYCDINNLSIDIKSKKGEGTKVVITFKNN